MDLHRASKKFKYFKMPSKKNKKNLFWSELFIIAIDHLHPWIWIVVTYKIIHKALKQNLKKKEKRDCLLHFHFPSNSTWQSKNFQSIKCSGQGYFFWCFIQVGRNHLHSYRQRAGLVPLKGAVSLQESYRPFC